MIPCMMAGASGRMGRTIIHLMGEKGSLLKLSGALDHSSSSFLGQDAGVVSGGASNGVPIVSDREEALKGAAVVIDFSLPDSTMEMGALCAEKGIPLVVGTTGLNQEQLKTLKGYSSKIPLIVAPNMSVGVNLLFHLTRIAASILNDGYDVEVVEAHHRYKKDAPSGTAMRLKEVLLDALQREESDVIYGREGITGERPAKEIAVHALRGGDTVGDHTVYFMAEGERIELTHRASSRNTFATGAIRAAHFLSGASPGLYGMSDVLKVG